MGPLGLFGVREWIVSESAVLGRCFEPATDQAQDLTHEYDGEHHCVSFYLWVAATCQAWAPAGSWARTMTADYIDSVDTESNCSPRSTVDIT